MRDKISTITHLIGAILSALGIVFLVIKGINLGNSFALTSLIIFGLSMVLLYSASTTYHWIKAKPEIIKILKKVDHSMIFVLIAGTYTPICIIGLNNKIGYVTLAIVWSIAIIGILLKIFWINMPRIASTIIYVAMGWLSIFLIYKLFYSLPISSFILLIAGGLIYTIGGVIYGGKISVFNFKSWDFHDIWHLFVLGGSACHYFMVILM